MGIFSSIVLQLFYPCLELDLKKMGAKYILELGPLLPCIHESCLHYEQFTILKKIHREHHLTNVQQFIIRQMFSNSQRASLDVSVSQTKIQMFSTQMAQKDS
jgi:hypothetical protein